MCLPTDFKPAGKHCAWRFRKKKKEKKGRGAEEKKEEPPPPKSEERFSSFTVSQGPVLNAVPTESSRKSIHPVNPSLAAILEPSLPYKPGGSGSPRTDRKPRQPHSLPSSCLGTQADNQLLQERKQLGRGAPLPLGLRLPSQHD